MNPPPDFDDLDAAGFDPRFEDAESLTRRPTLSVAWYEVDGETHVDENGQSVWALGASASTAFSLDGSPLQPSDVLAFAEGVGLWPGFSARLTYIHRLAGFPVLRVQVDLDGTGALPAEDVLHTVLRKRGGEVHEITAHVDFAPVLAKVVAGVLAEAARYTARQVLDSKRAAAREEG